MKPSSVPYRLFLVLFGPLLFPQDGLCQQNQADAAEQMPALHHMIYAYYDFMKEESLLYNGAMEVAYDSLIEGFPYFEVNVWRNGSVEYDGVVYRDVPMRYDLIKDQLIIQHLNKKYAIVLVKERVKWFSVGGHAFIRIEQDGRVNAHGFYEQLCTGTITILARREKKIDESTSIEGLKRSISEHISFYGQKNGLCYALRNKRSLLNLMQDQQQAMQQYARKNHLRFGKDPAQVSVGMALFYNQLTH
jgi:hypothetical protein